MKLDAAIEILSGADLHRRVVRDAILNARDHVWIATANLKDLHLEWGRRFRPALEVFDRMAREGVRFRLVHGDVPSRPFQETLERFPALWQGGLELQICIRSHWKLVVVDGRFGWLGSANLTGAGLGARSERRRNLELGIASEDPGFVAELVRLYDQLWMGSLCADCGLRDRCPDPIDEP